VIDAVALGASVIASLGESCFDQIVAVELVLFGETPIRNGIQTDELCIIRDAGTADSLLVLIAMLRERFDQDVHARAHVLRLSHEVALQCAWA
jgi:hypothetical protein